MAFNSTVIARTTKSQGESGYAAIDVQSLDWLGLQLVTYTEFPPPDTAYNTIELIVQGSVNGDDWANLTWLGNWNGENQDSHANPQIGNLQFALHDLPPLVRVYWRVLNENETSPNAPAEMDFAVFAYGGRT